MKKEKIDVLILIVSIILIILNIFTSDKFDLGFWMRITANIFIIFGIIRLIKNKKSIIYCYDTTF